MLRPCLRIAAALVIVCPAAFARPTPQDSGPPPTPVVAVRAEVREMQARESVTGSLRAAFDAVLAAREEGAVLSVAVRAGGFVRKGDALVSIDTRRLLAQRASVEASLAEARAAAAIAAAEADDADQDLLALEAAAKKGSQSVSPRELRRARTLVTSLRAGVDAAEKREEALGAELGLWNLRIEDATLRAPFDGTVVETHVEVGEWVSPGTDVVRLLSTGQLEVWLDVPERFMGLLVFGEGPGGTGEIGVRAGAAKGEVIATNARSVPRVDPGTRTFPLVASIAGEAAAKLSPGMSASGWIPVGARTSTLMVPKDALVYRPAGVAVMTVGGRDEGGAAMAGVALMVPIKILFETRREVAVEMSEGGLAPGAAVIVEGNERLFPGTPVSARFAPLAADGPKGPVETGGETQGAGR